MRMFSLALAATLLCAAPVAAQTTTPAQQLVVIASTATALEAMAAERDTALADAAAAKKAAADANAARVAAEAKAAMAVAEVAALQSRVAEETARADTAEAEAKAKASALAMAEGALAQCQRTGTDLGERLASMSGWYDPDLYSCSLNRPKARPAPTTQVATPNTTKVEKAPPPAAEGTKVCPTVCVVTLEAGGLTSAPDR